MYRMLITYVIKPSEQNFFLECYESFTCLWCIHLQNTPENIRLQKTENWQATWT